MNSNQHLYSYKLEEFSYYQLSVDPDSPNGLKECKINTKNQLLFYDLQLMFLNQYLSPASWNEEIQKTVHDMISELLKNSDKNVLGLSDLYFEATEKQIQIYIIQNDYNEKKDHKKTIFVELQNFGRQIKSLNQLQKEKKFTLAELVQSALKVYSNIKFRNQFTNYREMICKRYVIEQILSSPQQNINQQLLIYEQESNSQNLFSDYQSLFFNVPKQIQGQLYMNCIFGKKINELEDQLFFLKLLKQKTVQYENYQPTYNYFYEKLLLYIKDPKQFKVWAFSWILSSLVNQQDTSENYPCFLKQITQSYQQRNIKEYFACQGNFFSYLVDIYQKNQELHQENQLNKPKFSKIDFIKQIQFILDSITQNKSIPKSAHELIDFQSMAKKIYDSLPVTRLQRLHDLDQLKEGELYQIIEFQFIEIILSKYADLFYNFYSIIRNSGDQNIKAQRLLKENTVKEIQCKVLTISEALQDLYQTIKSNCTLTQFQDGLIADEIIKDYPKIIKQYLIALYNQQQNNSSFKDFVQQQGSQFHQQIQWYDCYLKKFITQEIGKLIVKSNNFFLPQQLEILQKKTEQELFIKLFDIFIPYLDMEVYVKEIYFLNYSKRFVKELQLEFNSIFYYQNNFFCFIKEITYSYSQFQNFSQDERNDIEKYKQDLQTQFNQKILQGGISKILVTEWPKEKSQLQLQINSYFTNLVEIRIKTIYQENEKSKFEQLEEIKNKYNYYFLPFCCIEKQVEEMIWTQDENEKVNYFNQLQQFCQIVQSQTEQSQRNFERLINFGFTEKQNESFESKISDWMKTHYQQLDVNNIQPQGLSKQIIQQMESYYNCTEEQLNKKIQSKQREQLLIYENEIFELTQEQCSLILIPKIQLEKIEFDQLQQFRHDLLQITEKIYHKNDLETKTFQFFRDQMLSVVLEKYQEQIENGLKK